MRRIRERCRRVRRLPLDLESRLPRQTLLPGRGKLPEKPQHRPLRRRQLRDHSSGRAMSDQLIQTDTVEISQLYQSPDIRRAEPGLIIRIGRAADT